MEWKSPEIEFFYNIFNKTFSNIIKTYHPYVKLIYIDKESYNNSFNKLLRDVDVIVCADFSMKEYEDIVNKRSLGEDISSIYINLQKMLPGNEIIVDRTYPNLILNKTKYCENILKYHYK